MLLKMIDRPGSGQRPAAARIPSVQGQEPAQALAHSYKKEDGVEPVNFRNLLFCFYNFGEFLRTRTGAAPPPKPPGPCRCGMSQPVGDLSWSFGFDEA